MRAQILKMTAVFVFFATGALAHHGWSTYDATKTITFEGPVLASKYENPHGEVQINGEGGRWTITLAPVSRMSARGVAAEDIAVGKSVKVEGYSSRVNEREMRAERITVSGRVVELR